MHRFYVPPEQCSDAGITLTDREAHHGLNVVRIQRGESVVVLDGAGTEYQCEVAELAKHTIRLAVRQKNLVPRLPYQVTLIQAIPKGKLFDAIVQKATELGVARIVPLLSERVVTQLDDEKADAKAEHWRTTAIEAIKQCGSAWLPSIDIPTTLKGFLARSDSFDLALVGSLQPGSRHPRHWFQEFQQAHGKPPTTVAVWVGPEGDFTADEIATLQSAGVRPITLGRLVLRSETAATYCLSVLNYELSSPTV